MQKANSYKFPTSERLKSKKIIQELFGAGEVFFLHPFRAVVKRSQTPTTQPPQVLFSVGKKYAKSAVKRNYIRRRMKEAYRLQKETLLSNNQQQYFVIYIAFIWIAKEKAKYSYIQSKMNSLLSEIYAKTSK